MGEKRRSEGGKERDRRRRGKFGGGERIGEGRGEGAEKKGNVRGWGRMWEWRGWGSGKDVVVEMMG